MGCSRSQFETLCEAKYNEKLQMAIRQIERGEIPFYGSCTPNIFGVDFQSWDVPIILRKWNTKLDNAVAEYKLKYDIRKETEEAEERRHRDAEKQLELAKKEQEAQAAAERERRFLDEERERREDAERKQCEEEARVRHEQELLRQKKEQIEKRREESLNILTNEPYNMVIGEANKFIDPNGEINKDALATYENNQKNNDYIGRKAAEWESKKNKKETKPVALAIKCPSCGSQVGKDDKFCRKCGTLVQKECPSCKKLLPANYKFCSGCGTEL